MIQLSVIMPVFNQERYVRAAIQSVLNQTYSNFEFIIVDDGSTDRTVEIIESFVDERIRLIRAEHKGFIEALKVATAEAKGKWLARMDSDDVCTPDRFEKQLNFLDAHPECVFVTTFYGIVTPHDKYLTPPKSSAWHYLSARDVTLATLPFCDPGTIFDRKLALEIGYDDRMTWEKALWYELLQRGKGALMEEPLYFIRWRLGSLSRGQDSSSASKLYDMRRQYDPQNAMFQKENDAIKSEFRNMKKCLYFYAAAHDFSAVSRIMFSAWRRHPIRTETYTLIRFLFSLRRVITVYGPTGVELFPIDSPF